MTESKVARGYRQVCVLEALRKSHPWPITNVAVGDVAGWDDPAVRRTMKPLAALGLVERVLDERYLDDRNMPRARALWRATAAGLAWPSGLVVPDIRTRPVLALMAQARAGLTVVEMAKRLGRHVESARITCERAVSRGYLLIDPDARPMRYRLVKALTDYAAAMRAAGNATVMAPGNAVAIKGALVDEYSPSERATPPRAISGRLAGDAHLDGRPT